jgi:hypothetical protein
VAANTNVVNEAAGRRTSSAVLALALLAPLCALTGAALANLRIVDPLPGFIGIFLGVLLALLAVVGWLLALFLTRGGRNPKARRRAYRGGGAAVLYFAALIGLTLPTADLPRINDITTDTINPPEFVAAAELGPNIGRDMSYDPSFEPLQRAGYPALAPKILDRDVADTFIAIIASVPEEGRIEANVTSGIFHFVDDIVVRVKPHERGSIVDIRSKSRDGKGDLGANAARIEGVFLALR